MGLETETEAPEIQCCSFCGTAISEKAPGVAGIDGKKVICHACVKNFSASLLKVPEGVVQMDSLIKTSGY